MALAAASAAGAENWQREMVIAVPAALTIQGDDEQVGAFEILQGLLTGRDGSLATASHRGPHMRSRMRCAAKSLDVFGLLVQDFLHQVIQHEMVAAGKGLDKAGDVFWFCMVIVPCTARAATEGRQSSLRSGFQGGDVTGGQVQTHHLVEKIGGFGGVKRRSAARRSVSWPRTR